MKYGPIQIVPPGLLSMLNLKNVGRNPSELDSAVQPTLDMREWLMVQNRENLKGTFVPLTADSGVFAPVTAGDVLTVPDNEYWYLWNHTVAAGFLAGDSVQSLAAVVQHPGPSLCFTVNGQTYVAGPAPAVAYFVFAGGQVGTWLEPGAMVGAGGGRYTIATPGNVTVQVNAVITRLAF